MSTTLNAQRQDAEPEPARVERPWLKASGALAALVAVVAGVPAALIALAHALPVDLEVLTPNVLLRPDDGRLLLLVLFAIGWAAWAACAGSIALEVWAAVRRVPTPHLPGLGGMQRLAAALVTAVTLALAGGNASPAMAHAATIPAGISVVADSHGATDVTAVVEAADAVVVAPARGTALSTSAAQLTIEVQRHDTLWLLAEQYLGDGERFDEIVKLNRAVTQADGRALGDDGRLYPGWKLTMPRDARTDSPRPDRLEVRPGDTLWELADDELGDPMRYLEVFKVNKGDLQPGGGKLTDPDLIQPGWVLEVPSEAASAPRSRMGSDRSGSQAGPSAGPGASETASAEPSAAQTPAPSVGTPGGPASVLPTASAAAAPTSDVDSGEVASEPAPAPVTKTASPSASSHSTMSIPSATASPLSSGPGTPSASVSARSQAESQTAGEASATPTGPKAVVPQPPTKPTTASPGTTSLSPSAGPKRSSAAPSSGFVESTPASSPTPTASPTASASASDPTPTRTGASSAPAAPTSQAPTTHPPAATSTAGGPTASEPPAAASDDLDLAVLLPAGGLIGGLLALGFLGDLARRRRLFQRYRAPGEKLARISPEARALEAAALAGVEATEADLLDRALTQLAHNCWTAGRPLPDVRVAKLSRTDLTMHLAVPDEDQVAPFVAVSPDCWQLDTSALAEVAPEHPRAYPALVTLGVDSEQLILLNLESVGSISVEGPEARIPGALRALATELAFGPVRKATTRTLCIADGRLADAMEPGDLTVNPDAQSVARDLQVHVDALAKACGEAGVANVLELRPDDPFEITPTEIVLTDQELGLTPTPWSGAAVISAAGNDSAGATLRLDDEGGAVLEPGGHWLAIQTVMATELDAVVEALRSTEVAEVADLGHEERVLRLLTNGDDTEDQLQGTSSAPPGDEGDSAARPAPPAEALSPSVGAQALHEKAVPSDAPAHLPAHAPTISGALALAATNPAPVAEVATDVVHPMILLLGEVKIENAKGRQNASRANRLGEVAAFVLLNPDARLTELQTALWPGQRGNPDSCRQMVSRTRSLLGKDADGRPYLLPMAATNGRLRMSDEVQSDWQTFQELAIVGLAAGSSEIDDLRAALALVRGRPFGPTSGREMPWADLAINEMISEITDAAHELFLRESKAGRQFEARDAALRGLLTEAESELLIEDALLACKRLGDRLGADRLAKRLATQDNG